MSGSIPSSAADYPDQLTYGPQTQRLQVGRGCVERVPPAVWQYRVGGNQVLVQWFNSRRKDRSKSQIGGRRPPSPLGDIQPDHWLPEYTTELLNVLNVLGPLVALETQASELLDRICAGPLITAMDLTATGAFFPEGHTPAGQSAQGELTGFEMPGEGGP